MPLPGPIGHGLLACVLRVTSQQAAQVGLHAGRCRPVLFALRSVNESDRMTDYLGEDTASRPVRGRPGQPGCLQRAQVLLNIELTSIFTEWLLGARVPSRSPQSGASMKCALMKRSHRSLITNFISALNEK